MAVMHSNNTTLSDITINDLGSQFYHHSIVLLTLLYACLCSRRGAFAWPAVAVNLYCELIYIANWLFASNALTSCTWVLCAVLPAIIFWAGSETTSRVREKVADETSKAGMVAFFMLCASGYDVVAALFDSGAPILCARNLMAFALGFVGIPAFAFLLVLPFVEYVWVPLMLFGHEGRLPDMTFTIITFWSVCLYFLLLIGLIKTMFAS